MRRPQDGADWVEALARHRDHYASASRSASGYVLPRKKKASMHAGQIDIAKSVLLLLLGSGVACAFLTHLHRLDAHFVLGAVDISLHRHLVTFMTLKGIGVADGPALSVLVNDAFAIIAYFAGNAGGLTGALRGALAAGRLLRRILSERYEGNH